MIDLKSTTFLITLNIDSKDRMRNAKIVLRYLTDNFDTKIIVKEVDFTSKFDEVLSTIEFKDKIIHTFEKMSGDFIFHKSRYVNDLFEMAQTEIVSTYDIDVLLPLESYVESEKMCKTNYDLVYPFGYGMDQIMVLLPPEFSESNSKDFDSFRKFKIRDWHSTYGHVQFFKSKSFYEGFMMNENFSSYSPEDIEIGTRFEKLGYNIGRVQNKIIHLEHSRGINSSELSPCTYNNNLIWENLKSLDCKNLKDYYSSQEYYKKRIKRND